MFAANPIGADSSQVERRQMFAHPYPSSTRSIRLAAVLMAAVFALALYMQADPATAAPLRYVALGDS
jgi:hypothetical protein